MVIDSSALVAILLNEPEQTSLIDAITADRTRICGAPTLVETGMVIMSRRGEPGLAELRAFYERAAVVTAGFGAEHVDLAVDAFRRFGKGRHPAALNFGDCFSYALAKATGEPLLFKGDDFSQTDIDRAI
jgi:ribonuclease VapC